MEGEQKIADPSFNLLSVCLSKYSAVSVNWKRSLIPSWVGRLITLHWANWEVSMDLQFVRFLCWCEISKYLSSTFQASRINRVKDIFYVYNNRLGLGLGEIFISEEISDRFSEPPLYLCCIVRCPRLLSVWLQSRGCQPARPARGCQTSSPARATASTSWRAA